MSQLNFLLLPDEILDRLNSIIQKNDALVFSGRFFEHEHPKPFEIKEDTSLPDELTLWLNNSKKMPRGEIITEGPFKGKFAFDYYKDPIIQFHNCVTAQTTIHSGRIFYKSGWIDDDVLRSKHKKWAAKTTRIIDRNLQKLNKFWRISTAVEEWVNEGGSLELGPGGLIVNKQNFNKYR
ncbi:hypothetical protein SAMN05192574_110177 [Mucilaginibacter gossypiicola]|uniref:Uncharacterized protein n=1 Tax=Mucilaginibacter gossypiicola TaxID=551995 RepID=A0A1H8RJJ1_9SPHI|nr:hypothetical protein [Mucilaginibacter gossypiicola]SEO66338.1 hypothetical protein SAMN05192574_110177 [Mucilaginibacter gossypiicola]